MSATSAWLRQVRGLAGGDVSDAELLGMWVACRHEEAFTALVARHGAMVHRTCRAVLGDAHAAEDAAQAAFVVLARKAHAVRPAAGVAAWLHGVARRVALKARAGFSRRPPSEEGLGEEPVAPLADPLDELTARELLALLDEEIARLPRAYRLPVVLCCLEGRSHEEAAKLLGLSAGSVRGRLGRGRERLQARLARRGLTLTAALSCLEAGRGVALASSAISTTAFVVAHPSGAAPHVAALAEVVIQEMLMTRLKLGFGLVAFAGLLVGSGVAARNELHATGSSRPKVSSESPPPAGKERPAAAETPAAKEAKLLEGEWKVVAVGADGQEAKADDIKGMRWVIKGNEIQATDPDGSTGKMTFKIDPGKKPKQIDLIGQEGAKKGTDLGIYKLEEGGLTICLRSDMSKGKGRPTEFDGGPGLGMITFERVKK